LCVGHIAPEAMIGGPIGLLHEGDLIEVNIPERSINMLVEAAELERRAAKWMPPAPHYKSGVMSKYARTARQADDGAVTNF
jgi:dihydroxy-acid dehydratase